jgi:hypothetical protein
MDVYPSLLALAKDSLDLENFVVLLHVRHPVLRSSKRARERERESRKLRATLNAAIRGTV